MAYHTADYLFLFLPAALIVYQLAPRRIRWMVLLCFSLLFYLKASKLLTLIMAGSALITHYTALWISRQSEKKNKKRILTGGILVLLCILLYLKYYNFFVFNWNTLSEKTGILSSLSTRNLLLPLGISFYTLQAIGYMADVYWKKIPAQTDPLKTLLFLCFFPQIMEGPICAYSRTAEDLFKGDPLRPENLSDGCVRIFWGLFKKIIVADRLYVLVTTVFDNYKNFHGSLIAVAAIAYTVQLYMEFSGCMDIVIGSGRLFGVSLPENFRQPFFAVDAADFWRRWHMTLGVWFRTYIFFPVSVSPLVKKWNRSARKRFGKNTARLVTLAACLFPVWACNGLWHGARWTYIFYGMYYFVILFLTAAFDPVRDGFLKKRNIDKEAGWYKAIRIIKTWVIIFVGELFFRADTMTQGIQMFRSMFDRFSFSQLTSEMWLALGLDRADYLAVAAGCLVSLIVAVVNEKELTGGAGLRKFSLPARWCIYYALIISVVVFGAYGAGYTPVDLIYAGF